MRRPPRAKSQQLLSCVCHLSLSSTQQGNMGNEIPTICWLAWRSVTSVSGVDRVFAALHGNLTGDRSIPVVLRWKRATHPRQQPRRWKQTLLAWPAVMLLCCSSFLYCLFLHCKSCYWLCRALKDCVLSSAVCVCPFVRVCASVSRRSRYSIRTEQWQRASKDYKKQQINAYGTHAHKHTHIVDTHSENKVFSWHSERLSGLSKVGADRKWLLKQRKAVEARGELFNFHYFRWN